MYKKFTYEKFLEIADDLIWQHIERHLKDIEVILLKGIWEEQRYEQIAKESGYTYGYLCCEVRYQLFRWLSEALGRKIDRFNCKFFFKCAWEEKEETQANLTRNKIQLENILANSVDEALNNSSDDNIVENVDESLDLNRLNKLGEDVGDELSRELSRSFDEHTSEANSPAASTTEIGQDTEFDLDALLKTAENLILQHRGRTIRDAETAVLEGIWENKKVGEHQYASGHVNNIRSELWQLFSEALGTEVNKTTCKSALRQRWQQDSQVNFTSVQTRIGDCLFNFLLNPWNGFTNFIGNVKNNWKFLVKDTANKIWQKLSEVWQEKVTPKNWQEILQPKLDPNIALTEEIALQITSNLIFYYRKKNLHYLEEEIIRGTWQGKKYNTIAEEMDYSTDYLTKMARELWQDLSKVFAFSDCKISKNNFKSTLKLWYEDMKSSFVGFT